MYIDFNTHEYEEVFDPEHAYKFTAPCVVTGKEYTVTIPADSLFKLQQGLLIQDACRKMSADDREFLISGTSPEGWEMIFG